MKIDEVDMQAARAIVNELKTFATDEDLKRVAKFIENLRWQSYTKGKYDGVQAVLK